MKYVLLILFINIAGISWSQEIVSDTITEDSMYYDEDSEEYYDVYDEYDEEIYSGYISFVNFQLKHPAISGSHKFDSNPFGFEIGLYKQLNENLPFFIGANLSLDFYGKESYQYLDYGFDDGYEYQFSDDFTAYIFNFDLGGKYFSKKSFWVLNPYIQLDLEYRYAFGSINTVNLDLNETIDISYENGNSGFGYNLGIGSLIDISADGLFLNFSVNYNSGGGLFLYKRKSGDYDIFSVLDNFDYKYFPIGFLTFKLGVSFSK